LRQGLGLAIAGAAVGFVCALIVSHLMAGLLYGVRPTDPLTFASVALLLIGVALLACYIPARRALRAAGRTDTRRVRRTFDERADSRLDILMRFNKTRYRFLRLSGVRMRSIL
jgi:hypothetical protein